MNNCETCNRTFSNISSLRRHVKKFHNSEVTNLIKYKSENNFTYTCNCGKNFSHRHRFNYHLKTHKRDAENINYNKIKKDDGSKKCPLCEYKSSFAKNLIDHFEKLHDIAIKKNITKFSTAADFENYKSKIENDTRSFFVKKWTKAQ